MKVERIREKNGKLELFVELSVAETAEEMQRAAALAIARDNLDYDRMSTTPIECLRSHIGNAEAAFVVDEDIMKHRAPFALTAARVDVIGSPVFRCSAHAEEGKPFSYQLVCVPVPEYELDDYGPVSITAPKPAVSESEIDAEIERLASLSPASVTVTGHDIVEKGDRVELAMTATLAGKPVRALCSDSREYATGTLSMPDDFDAAVIGMRVGETKEFTFLGPDFELDDQGKPRMDEYEATVTVKRIVESKAPALDDEWAQAIKPGVTSLHELRERIASGLMERRRKECSRAAGVLAGDELAKRLQGTIPDLVYGVAIKEARDELGQRLVRQNMTMDDFLAQQQLSQEQFSNVLMMQVRSQLTRQLALNAYAKHCGLVAEEEDVDEFFESIAPGKANLARADFQREGRMYAARCAALRLKAGKRAAGEAGIAYDDAGQS